MIYTLLLFLNKFKNKFIKKEVEIIKPVNTDTNYIKIQIY